MRIDLHCHTKKVKTGDPIGRNVTPELFAEKVSNANVQIVAITNHNEFDLDQYETLNYAVLTTTQLWPGIELDVDSASRKWHLLVIGNPKNSKNFYDATKALINGKSPETFSATFQVIHEILSPCDVLFIPHFHKTPSISEEELISIEKIVNEKHRILYETSDLRSLGVFSSHGYRVIIGSDVKDWTTYEKCQFAELRLPVSSFSQFCLFLKRDTNVVNKLLATTESLKVSAKPHQSVNIELKLFKEVNILFGHKGTGKSQILKSVSDSIRGQSFSLVNYAGSEKEDEFKRILDSSNLTRNVKLVDANGCENSFAFFNNWQDVSPMPVSRYFDWMKTTEANANKSRMKITNTRNLLMFEPEVDVAKIDFEKMNSIKDNFRAIDVSKYLQLSDEKSLNELLQKLSDAIEERLVSVLINSYAMELTNFSIQKIKNIADKNTSTVSRPPTTGFFDFASNRVTLLEKVRDVLDDTQDKKHYEDEYLGELEGKGKVFIRTLYKMLDKDSIAYEFQKNTFRKLQDLRKHLEELESSILTSNAQECLNEINSACFELDICDTSPFLGISKNVVDEYGNPYSPSTGEKGVLLLQRALNAEADAYILDEPDLGMGNSYIDLFIRPKISALGKNGKLVLVATHNANIAVRTLPYNSILRKHSNGVFSTYVGNPFVDLLTRIDDPNDVLSWTQESLNVLEGSEEAFYERKSIYESGSN